MNSDDSILLTHDGHGLLVKQDALKRIKLEYLKAGMSRAADAVCSENASAVPWTNDEAARARCRHTILTTRDNIKIEEIG